MKADRLFWGIIFVFIGGIFLLENFGVIDFSWGYIWRFWPILLIVAGINIVFSRSHSKVGAIATVIITVVALAFVTVMGLKEGHEHRHHGWMWNFSDDAKDGMDDGWNDGSNQDSTVSYQEAYEDSITHAVLNIKGGAAKFYINSSSSNLFSADTRGQEQPFYVLRTEKQDSTTILNFTTKKDTEIHFDDNHPNDIHLAIHPNPIWDINLTMGAGKADFDLTPFKMHNVNLKGGAAEFDVKLGNLSNDINFTSETGVAKVNVEVPQGSGCQIHSSTGLSSKTFDGFINKGNSIYETANYASAKHKIHITIKGGLSDISVSRY